MKKFIILQAILLLNFASYSHAAETNCNDDLKRNQVASEACRNPLPQIKEVSNEPAPTVPSTTTATLTKPQNVLCSQCHQNAETFKSSQASGSPHSSHMQN